MFELEHENSSHKDSIKRPVRTDDLVHQQVVLDLEEALQSSSDPKKTLKVISKKTGVHSKTLHRIIKGENKPAHLTVFRIYQYLTKAENEAEVLERCPDIIRNYLPEKLKYRLHKKAFFQPQELSTELQNNPVMGELYIQCAAGPITEQEIVKRFGEYGLQLAYELVGKKVLQISGKSSFSLGENIIFLTPECIQSLGLIAIKNYAKPKNGYLNQQHFMGFIAEGLSDEAYKKWIQIDTEAYQQKSALAQDPTNLGSKKAFSFNITETLLSPEPL